MRLRRTVLIQAAQAPASLHEISRNCRYRMLIPTPQQTTFNQEKFAKEREAFLSREGSPPDCNLPCCIYPNARPARTSRGGIAQLVERQLCKLEVRGSNPLASKDWVAHASRVLAKPSRVRGLFQDRFGETPKPARGTRALPGKIRVNHATRGPLAKKEMPD